MTTTLPTWLSRALNLVGILVVGSSIFSQWTEGPAWLFVAVVVSLVGWALLAYVRDRAPFAVIAVTVATGGIATVFTDGVDIVPVIVAIIVAVGAISRPAWQGVATVLLGAALVPAGLLLTTIPAFALVSMECGILVATIGGFSRRQARRGAQRERELLEQRARGAALAERQAVARDIHDVLAHSLGGLVIQLDAIDAQLEAGRVADAATRVRQARELAASGLAEARRAVDALRDARGGTVGASALELELVELVDAHRMLGGVVDFTEDGTPVDLPAEHADALRRALQESLTNARKHAAGQPVAVHLHWDHGAELEVSNRLPARAAAPVSTGGHGLRGMAERVSRFGAANAGEVDGRFVVHVRVDA